MSEQNQNHEEELNVEELEDVAGGALSQADEASTNIGCTNYGCS